jgi:hypothetical protein
MTELPVKVISQLNNYVFLEEIRTNLNDWQGKFVTEANRQGYSLRETKYSNEINLRKGNRGSIEILFKGDQKDVVTFFGYRTTVYFKIIAYSLFICFNLFLYLEIFIDIFLSDLHTEVMWGWGFLLSFLSGGGLLIFALIYVFMIAKYDFNQRRLLSDQREALMQLARETQITPSGNPVAESSQNEIKEFPLGFKQTLILRNMVDLNTWRNRFFTLVKQKSYLIEPSDVLNFFFLVKSGRYFECGFKKVGVTLFLFFGFRRPHYASGLIFGSLALFIVSGVLAGIADLFWDAPLTFLFLSILIASGIFFVGFLAYYRAYIAKYDTHRGINSPETIDDLMKIALEAQGDRSTAPYRSITTHR